MEESMLEDYNLFLIETLEPETEEGEILGTATRETHCLLQFAVYRLTLTVYSFV